MSSDLLDFYDTLYLQVVKQLKGEEKLPWETGRTLKHKLNSIKYIAVLKSLHGPIMHALRRNAEERCSMAVLAQQCRDVIDASGCDVSKSKLLQPPQADGKSGTLSKKKSASLQRFDTRMVYFRIPLLGSRFIFSWQCADCEKEDEKGSGNESAGNPINSDFAIDLTNIRTFLKRNLPHTPDTASTAHELSDDLTIGRNVRRHVFRGQASPERRSWCRSVHACRYAAKNHCKKRWRKQQWMF